jgi:hypothetical protein
MHGDDETPEWRSYIIHCFEYDFAASVFLSFLFVEKDLSIPQSFAWPLSIAYDMAPSAQDCR